MTAPDAATRLLALALGLLTLVGAPSARADEAAARTLAQRAFDGRPIDAFRRLPDLPFYEIWINRTLVYTDLDAKVLILGNLLDGKTLGNLRQQRISELMAIPLKDLPIEHAIKTVQGRGSAKLVVFADPNCGYCRNFELELKKLKHVTIYTVMYPVLGPDSRDKARAILCAPKAQKAWRAWMDHRQPPPTPASACQPALDSVLAFGKEHDIGVTPTTFLANGRRLPGTMPAATLMKEIAEVRSAMPPAAKSSQTPPPSTPG